MVTKLPKVDVVTTGVGWTGGIVAAELTKAGYKVVGLERGEDRTIEDYLHGHDELKYNQRKELMQKLTKDTITWRNTMDQDAVPVRDEEAFVVGTGVGGGGAHWGAQTYRYFPYDFEIKSKTIERYGESKIPKDMLIQDWGLSYDEIEPYYSKFEQMAGVSGEEDPLAGPRSIPYPTPPMKKNRPMRLFHEAAEKLGYHPYVVPAGTVSEVYTNPDGETLNACQYCSFCGNYGCEYGAKADPVVTVVPTAKKTGNFELRTNCLVTRVLYDGDKATGVLYKDTRTGEEFEQPAEIVAMTSYVFNNIRLLLLSGIGEPYDPKTGKGIIGKNYVDHHTIMGATGFFDEKFNLYAGTGALGSAFTDYCADNFDHSDVDFIHGGQIEIHIMGNEPIANNPVPAGTPAFGKEFKEKSLHYSNRTLSVVSQRAFMPWKNHYLDLDPAYTDDNGDPLIRVTFDYTDQDCNLNEFLADKCAGVLKEMGAEIIDKHPMPEHFGGRFTFQHDSGGAIMGSSPENSAVNNYLQMWDVDNLFVCGASAFPHFGPTNPTPTTAALTYRATEGMIEYLKNGGGQLVKTGKETQNV
ncbi:GMC family oxidoreductase [Oceanobacillus damuensis]|uniref:GMC family oxidoreductase n=1 Tax=Oceanobacillus damuensis TaxID=937928 RepID=UPI0008351567|nr:GMC family oxidoreductase [Oceanobacillus damuensis]